ncbi:MAG TPA: hypothetical protein PK504_11690 [Ferruginibacter sp.]|nr:hypothetical protein [Ferruginibacter sp.]HRE63106.1 hypothetical protein [Ferruginibacter sp.]
MMKAQLFSILFLFASSCSNTKSTEIILSSETTNNIDSIIIKSYGVSEKFINLNSTPQIRTIRFNTSQINEGGFTLIIFQNDSIVNAGSFGYFSGKKDIKAKYKVKVLKDYSIKEVDK